MFILTLICRSNSHVALSVKRLWQYLVKQDQVQETFIRNIFTKKRCLNEVGMMYQMCRMLQVSLSFCLFDWLVYFIGSKSVIQLAMFPNLRYLVLKVFVHGFVEKKNNWYLTAADNWHHLTTVSLFVKISIKTASKEQQTSKFQRLKLVP